PPGSPLFPYTTLFRSGACLRRRDELEGGQVAAGALGPSSAALRSPAGLMQGPLLDRTAPRFDLLFLLLGGCLGLLLQPGDLAVEDRKSTRLNSSHVKI